MARTCEITGKSRFKGNKVSHSQVKTIKHSSPNLRTVKVSKDGVVKRVKIAMNVYKRLRKTGEYKGYTMVDARIAHVDAKVTTNLPEVAAEAAE